MGALTYKTATAHRSPLSNAAAIRSLHGASASAEAVARRLAWVNVVLPMDPSFYKIARSGFVPYGVVSDHEPGRPVYELYWYSRPTGGADAMRYGATLAEIRALASVSPPDLAAPAPLAGADSAPWVAASVVPSAEDLAAMRPLLFEMHPLPPYELPTGEGEAEQQRAFLAAARAAGLPCVPGAPPPAPDPWGAPRPTMALLFADAVPANVAELVRMLLRGGTDWTARHLCVHGYTHVRGEPELWLTEVPN